MIKVVQNSQTSVKEYFPSSFLLPTSAEQIGPHMAETMATKVSAMVTNYDKSRTELPKNRIASKSFDNRLYLQRISI
ncbi:hypothetical protein ATZ36_15065 [Candidatus Endomicrobiellum trichonymphae]|uniref:Uncharacterized protein n=1 Tax=Endomicrobium trichonymphae TaxID=1408204 RepID=A0A1E5ILT3_ENDTX|nr:hypothetical protein ATZ36_15065 [Candidatus Endomicrobium trichonymphae]